MCIIIITASSNMLTATNCPKTSATSRYAEYLKRVYKRSPVSNDGKFPPTPSEKYVNLAVVKHRPHDLDELRKHTLHGRVNDLLVNKTKISIDEIVGPTDSLVIVGGPPGIGKSTLAWELCRRCDELPSMRQYSLVVLHRFRDKEVQGIKEASGLFPHPVDRDLQQSVIEEAKGNDGKGTLFILDGFDEVPVHHRRDGFLTTLIQGRVFPNCTVLVTSRPSATDDLMRVCRPQITRHVEILGFTEECVKEYAFSIFSSEPEILEGFLTYISASKNPSINSLMYVPLNAAIVVEIYRNSWSTGCPIPKTLTQLYTQLCLILVQRFLEAKHPSDEYALDTFSDIPEKYQDDFLNLSKVAFEGLENNEVIFHSLPKDVIHFGFLNTVSALYGNKISHNFLHLTLQEFLAAYYISQLPHRLVVFKQYCRDSRWDVAWVFFSGLTHFQSFKECNNIKRFASIKEESIEVEELLVNCIFEAQVPSFDYNSFFKTTKLIRAFTSYNFLSPLSSYALGYCIANSSPNTRWSLVLEGGSPESLIWGLNSTKNNCCGIIAEMSFSSCSFSMELFKQCPRSILEIFHHLEIAVCYGNYVSDMVHLEDVIPLCKKLSSLVLIGEEINTGLLNQLCDSNVSNLELFPLKLTFPLTHDFLAVMAKLIHPSSGNLKSLTLTFAYSDVSYDAKEFYDLVLASSSLHKLHLHLNRRMSISLSLHLLETNSCLTDVTIECTEIRSCSQSLVYILQRNNVLQHLRLSYFSVPADVDILRVIITALQENTVLKELILCVKLSKIQREQTSPSQYIEENYSHLNLDSRVLWDSSCMV